MTRRRKAARYSNWGEDVPAQEQRATQPDEPRHVPPSGRYKDKKHWCRGKIGGQRHTGVIELRRDRAPWLPVNGPRCFRPEWGTWWHCDHREICSNPLCRKVLRWSLGEDCPDYSTEVTLTNEMLGRLRRRNT